MNEDRPARGLFNVGVNPEEIWCLGKTIGKGAFGFVHVATSIENEKKQAAVKLISVDDPDDVETIRKEVKILTSCNHQNIVAFDNTYLNGETLWLVMEYCGGGSVADLLRFRALKENEIAFVLFETLKGLNHLHLQNIIHRDLKSANLLLTDQGIVKVADFGVSKILLNGSIKTKTFVGTPHWMAPEIIQGKEYDSRCDMWSVGIVGIELAEQHPPKYEINMHGVLAAIPKAPAPKLQHSADWSQNFIQMLSVLLVKDPNERPTAQISLEFPFFREEKKLSSGHQMLISFIQYVSDAKKRGKLPPKPRRRAVRQGGFTFSSTNSSSINTDETTDTISEENNNILGEWDTTVKTKGAIHCSGTNNSSRMRGMYQSSSSKYGGYTQSSLFPSSLLSHSTRTLQSLRSTHSSWSSLSDSRKENQMQQRNHNELERTSAYSDDSMVTDPFAKRNELSRTLDHKSGLGLRPLGGILEETVEEVEDEGEDNIDEHVDGMIDEAKEVVKKEEVVVVIDDEEVVAKEGKWEGEQKQKENVIDNHEEMWDRIVLQRVSLGFSKSYGASNINFDDNDERGCVRDDVASINEMGPTNNTNVLVEEKMEGKEHDDVVFMRELLKKCEIPAADVDGTLINLL